MDSPVNHLFAAIITNIEDYSEQTKKLEEEITLQRLFIDNMPGLFFYKDDKNNMIRVNKAVEDLMGVPREKLEGAATKDFFGKELAAQYYKDDMQVINSGKPKLNYSEPVESPEGTRYVSTSKFPFIDKDGNKGIVAYVNDVTEIETRKRDLEKFQEELGKHIASNLELSQFAGKISTNLIDALNSIETLAHIVAESEADNIDKISKKNLRQIEISSKNSAEFVKNTLKRIKR